jgi:type IV pilus assembly protein PilO
MRLQLRELLLFSLMIALLGASWWFGFKRVDDRKEQYRAEAIQKEQELADLEMATSGIADLDRRIDDLAEANAFFDQKLPKEKDLQETLRRVWHAAEKNGLDIRNFEPGKTTRGSHYSEQPIKLDLVGDFEGFYAYTLEIEQMDRLTRTTSLDISKIDGRDGKTEAEMTISVFFEPASLPGTVVSAR